ncbi:hypothetical protein T4C_519 [Trichinella pseudospiralis]|uniref:Uncharacterized protein n=2 Tax=Trichinella pseudospiralis TaxID=6337 RepID=A0A0V1IMS4_TRIPS|nr:hypothetical protein T4C_519 [Trichinella pseudospiralis]
MIGQAAADRSKCWVIRRLQHEPRTNSFSNDGSVAERIREKSCQCRRGRALLQTMCHCSGGERCVKGRSVHLQKTAACLSDSVPDFGTECRTEEKRVTFTGGKLPLYLRNCKECSEGENSSGAERVKSHGQYWVGRDKIVRNLLEGTRFIEENVTGQKNSLPLSQCANRWVRGGKRIAGTVSERKCSEMIAQAAADRTKCLVIRPLNMNPGLEDGSVAERIREKSCQCRIEHGKIEEGRFCQTMCPCSGGERCVKATSVHLQKTAACLSDSVPDCGKLPLYLRNCKECSEGENSSGEERVKSHGQYWVGRDKIVRSLLEGTRYWGIEMRAKMARGKGALGIM